MGALACKGLHCAGCGKGIPALCIFAVLLVLAAMGLPSVLAALAIALYWLAGAVVVGGISIAIGITRLHNSRLQGCVVWDDSPMMSDIAQFSYVTRTGQSVPIWPDHPAYLNEGWRGGLPVLPHADDGTSTPASDLSASSPPFPIPDTLKGGCLDDK